MDPANDRLFAANYDRTGIRPIGLDNSRQRFQRRFDVAPGRSRTRCSPKTVYSFSLPSTKYNKVVKRAIGSTGLAGRKFFDVPDARAPCLPNERCLDDDVHPPSTRRQRVKSVAR